MKLKTGDKITFEIAKVNAVHNHNGLVDTSGEYRTLNAPYCSKCT